MFEKGESVFLKYVDGKTHKVFIENAVNQMYTVRFSNGNTIKATSKYLSNEKNDRIKEKKKSKPKITKAFKKIGEKKVTFGHYKDKNISIAELLKSDEEYCRVVTCLDYNVPDEFKKYCSFMLL